MGMLIRRWIEWILGFGRCLTLPAPFEKVSEDPIRQFGSWFDEARRCRGLLLPEAVCLGTVSPDGAPEGRMMLLKGFDAAGFVFYTNLESQKAESLKATPLASLTFHWAPLGRQVRIQGRIEKVSDSEADEYFGSRPRGSQIGAWASRQSAPIPDRQALEGRFAELEKDYQGKEMPRPPYWGGFRLVPERIEFWQERPNRLHDRFLFKREGGRWVVTRLSP